MKKAATLVVGAAGVGAALMYFLDPDRGKRRRARVRDKAIHVIKQGNDAIDKTARDISNRVQGILSEAGALIYQTTVEDEVLTERVRSKIGRVVSRAHDIKVTSQERTVTLEGTVSEEERQRLLNCVTTVRGVKGVVDKLGQREQAEETSISRGRRPKAGERSAFLQANWSPTARVIAGATGGALAVYGARHFGLLGLATGAAGIGLLTRAITNMEPSRILGMAGTPGVAIQKTINIEAPVEEVFEFWIQHENFPAFMRNVREVNKIGENRYHWRVAGPAGINVEWDGEINRVIPNQLITFRSLPKSIIEQSGTIRFDPISDSDTRVDIKMSYNPPAGALGHLVAMLFGADPKSDLDEDLMRMKALIETGHVPHDAARKSAARQARVP
jgi:uncharacterized membrane protein